MTDVDIKIEFTGLRPGEKMFEELSLGNEKRYKTANDLIMVNEHMEKKKYSIISVFSDFITFPLVMPSPLSK